MKKIKVNNVFINRALLEICRSSICCSHGKSLLYFYNIFYIIFLQVFAMSFSIKSFQSPSDQHAGDHFGNKSHLYSVFYPW